MSWLKKVLIFSVIGVLAGCGVKGDPLPPEKPVELGRGRPTYKRATEGIQIQRQKPTVEEEEEDDDEERQ